MRDIEQIAKQVFEGDAPLSRADLMTLAHAATMWRGIAASLANDVASQASPARAQELIDLLEFRRRADISRAAFDEVVRKLHALAARPIN